MPILGYDVFQIPDHETEKAVTDAPLVPIPGARGVGRAVFEHVSAQDVPV
jgi:hypothetical protein